MLEYDKLYTVEEVAQRTGLTDRTIRNYLKDGRLKGKKIGGQWRFTADDIEALFRTPGEENVQRQTELDRFLAVSCVNSNPDVCAVVDCECEEAFAKELAVRIYAELDNPANGYTGSKVEYTYSIGEKKARYILRGSADFVASMLKMVKKHSKKA